jgi:hypothetical protein
MVLILFLACFVACQDKKLNFSDVTTEEVPDSLFSIHKDSMDKYFGPLEQALVRKYKENHKRMETQEEFYSFYRNTHVLKNNLKKTLQAHIKDMKERGIMAEDMPDFSWFKLVAEGLEVADVQNHKNADVFYDYNMLLKYAQKTEGTADDEYTKLIRLSFEDDRYYPVWVKPLPENEDLSCSLLGDGKHYKVFEQIIKARNAGDLFDRELAKLKSLLYRDIFFRKEYCLTAKDAISELELMAKKLDLKESDKKLFKARITQFQTPEKYKIQFNCESGDCQHDTTVKPDL